MYVAVVQAEWNRDAYLSEKNYHDYLEKYLDGVKGRIPQKVNTVLVSFPEDFGTFLVFCGAPKWVLMAPSLDMAIRRLILLNLPRTVMMKLKYGVSWIRALALVKSDMVRRIHGNVFSKAARKYGFWLVAGTVCAGDGRSSSVFNECQVFDPDGGIVLSQRKVHLIDLEGPQGLDVCEAPLDGLDTFVVDGMRVAVAICLDAFKSDVLDSLCKGKVDILIQPSANPEVWSPEQQEDWMTGIWQAVTKEHRARWGLNPMFVGNLLGLDFQGQSSIVTSEHGRAGLRGGYNDHRGFPGFVSVAGNPIASEVLVAEIC